MKSGLSSPCQMAGSDCLASLWASLVIIGEKASKKKKAGPLTCFYITLVM
jgi:hypothetical protein